MFQRITQLAAEGLRYSADLILPAVCVSCSALITRHNLLCPPMLERHEPYHAALLR